LVPEIAELDEIRFPQGVGSLPDELAIRMYILVVNHRDERIFIEYPLIPDWLSDISAPI
jgi:hypothetical protein